MWTLVLYAFLSAGPDVPTPRTVSAAAGQFTTREACQQAKGAAMAEAKRQKWTHIGGACVPTPRKEG